jgi:hypothetical protein
MSAVFSTNTTVVVQVPEGCTIPTSGGVSAVSYSGLKAPYGFPSSVDKWRLRIPFRVQTATTSNANFGAFASSGWQLTVPIGDWGVGYDMGLFNSSTTAFVFNLSPTDLTGVAKGSEDIRFSAQILSSAALITILPTYKKAFEKVTTAIAYRVYTQGATTSGGVDADNTNSEIFAENALL